jgi:hypothetical protein
LVDRAIGAEEIMRTGGCLPYALFHVQVICVSCGSLSTEVS